MKTMVASVLVALAVAASAAAGTISGVTATRITNAPQSIAGETTATDGSVWFVAWKDNAIGRLASDGSIKLFPIPTPNAFADQITTGGDGNFWFTEQAGKIGRITPEGMMAEFPTGASVSGPIVRGSDGGVWFMETTRGAQLTTKLGRIVSNGTITTYDLPGSDSFATLASGPNGRLWLFDATKNAVVIVSPKTGAVVATYPMPAPADPSIGFLHHFIFASDGNMWLTHNNSLVRIKPDGTMTTYTVPTPDAVPAGLANGGDGNLWFTEYKARKLAQLIVSTASDSGTATINESDPVLGNGSVDLVLLTNRQTRTATAFQPLDAQNPCQGQTFLSWFTIDGIWYSITRTAPPAQRCADLSATVDIIDGLVETRGALNAGAKLGFECTMFNGGPNDAADATMRCNGDGVVLNATVTGDPSCTLTIPPSPIGSVLVTSTSLAPGQYCTVHADWSVGQGKEDSRFALVGSNTFDPNPGDNTDQMYWAPGGGRSFTPPYPTVPAPVTRGGH